MKTVIVGICDISIRRHFVGLWNSMGEARMALDQAFEIKSETIGAAHDDEGWTYPNVVHPMKPIRMWNAQIRENFEESGLPGTLTEDGFTLYEVGTDLGYVGFEED